MAEYVDKQVIIDKMKEHREFLLKAWGDFQSMPEDDKKVFDAYGTCWSDVVNAKGIILNEFEKLKNGKPTIEWLY